MANLYLPDTCTNNWTNTFQNTSTTPSSASWIHWSSYNSASPNYPTYWNQNWLYGWQWTAE
jgi:hypothetical protein